MKKTQRLIIVALSIFITSQITAQDLSNFNLIAHYSMINTGVDETGNYDALKLINAPFQGDQGIYSNGNYIGSDADSCEISTPALTEIDFTQFAVSLEFKATDLSETKPIFVGGIAWRWVGAYLFHSDSTLHLFYNGKTTSTDVQLKVTPDAWHTATVVYQEGKGLLYLDGMKADSIEFEVESADYDKKFTNSNGGTGKAFKGNMRNYKFYGPKSTINHNYPLTDSNVTLYPNPSSSVFKISGLKKTTEPHTIEVFSAQGKRIIKTTCSDNEYLLDLADYRSGVYILLIDNRSSHRLLKK